MNADGRAGAHRGHGLRLGEDLRVGADADFEILRPQPVTHEHDFRVGCGLRARFQAAQTAAKGAGELLAQSGCRVRVALGPLFDDAFDQAVGESYAGGLDRLKIAGRQQCAVSQCVRERAKPFAAMPPNAGRRMRQIEQIAQGRRERGKIVKPILARDDGARTGMRGFDPYAPNQRSHVCIAGKNVVR